LLLHPDRKIMLATSILIADVDSESAHELALHVEAFGYRVVGVACSSEDALARIQELEPDLVLMNICLRGAIDGIETGNLIRTYRNIPIIYLVDTSGYDTIRRAGATEPFGYIFQPYDEKRIFATLETALIRHELESKLHESRQWLNTTLTSIGDGVIATDENGRVRFINLVALEQTGWRHAEAVGKSLPEVFPLINEVSRTPIDLLGISAGSVAHQKGASGILLSRYGKPITVETKITSIQDGRGQVHGRVLVFRDVTRQREILQEIRRQADRAEALVDVASQINSHLELDAVLSAICEITNRVIRASATAVLLQHPQKDVFQNMAAKSDDPALAAYEGIHFEIPMAVFNAMLSRGRPVHVIQDLHEFEAQPYFAEYRKMDIRTLAIAALFQEGHLTGVLVSLFSHKPKTLLEDDVLLLKGLADQASSAIEHAELFEQVRAGRERQRRLTKSLVDIQETERRRIARELHDHLGQSLTGLQFMLETAKNKAQVPQRTELEQIQEAVSEIIRDVREMSLNLRPSMLDDMGLVPTLLWHFDRYTSQTGIHVNFQYEEFPRRIPLEIETAAYRIVQEALTNVARHAQVQEVFVGLVMQDDTLWVEILDNGRGFDPIAEPDRPSSGLSGMRERADLLGGYLLVESFLHQGTQILAALPLSDQPLERRKHERYSGAGG
jgi:PAS domain S-box-containing protein